MSKTKLLRTIYLANKEKLLNDKLEKNNTEPKTDDEEANTQHEKDKKDEKDRKDKEDPPELQPQVDPDQATQTPASFQPEQFLCISLNSFQISLDSMDFQRFPYISLGLSLHFSQISYHLL